MQVTTSLQTVKRFWEASPDQDRAKFAANHTNDIEKKVICILADLVTFGFATVIYRHFFMNGMEAKKQDVRDMETAVANQMNSYPPGFLGTKVKMLSVECMMNDELHTITYVQTENDVEISLDHDSSFCVVIKNTNFVQMLESTKSNFKATTDRVNPTREELIEVKEGCHVDCYEYDFSDSDEALLHELKGGLSYRKPTDHSEVRLPQAWPTKQGNKEISKSNSTAGQSGDEVELQAEATSQYKNQQHAMLMRVDSSAAMEELSGRLHKLHLMRQLSLPTDLYYLGSKRQSESPTPVHPATPSEPNLPVIYDVES